MQHGGKADDAGEDMRDDAERAAEGGKQAGTKAAADAERQRIDDTRAGQQNDDERGDEEFGGHVVFPC